jgi:hypothetical protein
MASMEVDREMEQQRAITFLLEEGSELHDIHQRFRICSGMILYQKCVYVSDVLHLGTA